MEGILHVNDAWHEKRNAVELLMVEGGRFFQLGGDHKGKRHEKAYHDPAAQVEDVIQKEGEQGKEPLVTSKTDSAQ